MEEEKMDAKVGESAKEPTEAEQPAKVDSPKTEEPKTEQPVQPAEPKKKSNGCLWAVIIVVGVIILFNLIGFIFPMVFFGGIAGFVADKVSDITGISTSVTSSSSSAANSGRIDSLVIGEWDTGCLVPDANSPWAERHTFSIRSNATANHKRYTAESCAGLTVDHNENYTLNFPDSGQIDFIPTADNIEEEPEIYDIYAVSGNSLKFGHGFCNCTSTGGHLGGSAADRITRINDFLDYKKVQ